ncbi:MAG TPA: site-specific DNA-methyltransferase [Chitinophagaceae bacterium]|nr:site-specific DNA-methyltransferase [Chitinophagaceae bacterium]
MNGESLNIEQDNLAKLKEQFPNLFTEGKLDWEKLKATFSDDINFANERYVLNWAGKSDAFKALQVPTTATLKPMPDESVNFDTTENIFIEGENLEVLKVLQKSYYNKIKCIIIDPPYNTGSDSFIYPDSFKENKADYEKRIGDKDEEGYLMKEGMFRKNSKDSGHFHSNWLSMMYPRLFLAKNLLKDDGVIFVHIDDNEVHNLRLMMNEIFGEENFVDCVIWKKRYGGGAKEKHLVSLHEYALVYAKTIDNLNPIYIPNNKESIERYYTKKDDQFEIRGGYRTHPLEATKSMGERKNLVFPIPAPDGTEVFPKRQWLWSKDRALEALKKDELEFLKDKEGKWSVHTKQYLKDESGIEREIKAFSIIDNVFSQHGTNEIIELFGDAQIFSFPKPTGLIKQLLNIGIEEENEIILDFFCGSASVAHAALQLNLDDKNRRFIMVQLPEPVEEGSPAFNAGFRTIADISKERIRRVIKKIEIEKAESQPNMFENQEQDLGFKAFCLTQSNFKIWRGSEVNVDNLVQQLEAFTDPVYANSLEQNMLYELMLKAGYLLTDVVREYNILNEGDDEAEHIDTRIYLIADGELIIALDKINQFVVQLIIDESPKKVIMLDNLFTGNDQLKTNTVLQMKDAEIDFKTI